MRSLYTKAFAIVLALFFGLPHFALAATFSLSPASGSFEVGKTFSVRVTMSSTDQAVNAASAVINFPTNKLRVTGVSKSNSVLTLWVQEPSFSNSAGTVSFEGVVPNPGFTGVSASTLLITFKVLEEGTASVKFSNGSLLANDGEGTNIARDLTGASYTLIAGKAEEPAPVKSPSVEPAKAIETEAVTESIKAPVFTDYPKKLEEGTPLKIRGTSYPGASVTVSLKDARGQVFSQIVTADTLGDFALLWQNKVDRGDYDLTGIATFKGVKSLSSDVLSISIIPTSASKLKFAIVDYTSLIVILLLCLALLIVLILYLVKGVMQLRRKIWQDATDAERGIRTEFDDLKDAVRKELLVLENVESKRELTREELQVKERINRHIARIEKNIKRRVDIVKSDVK